MNGISVLIIKTAGCCLDPSIGPSADTESSASVWILYFPESKLRNKCLSVKPSWHFLSWQPNGLRLWPLITLS